MPTSRTPPSSQGSKSDPVSQRSAGAVRRIPPAVSVNSPLDPESEVSSPRSHWHHAETASLTESVTNYPERWGRTYHRFHEGSYLYPNDAPEIERLNNQHIIFDRYFDGKLFWSPLQANTTTDVLDLGTGTGYWPIELSDSGKLPKAKITGIDLSSIQPTEVPENVFFEIQDCSETDWSRDEDSFDLIHARFLAGSLASYQEVIETSRKYLKPGSGWVELHEIDPTPLCDDSSMPEDWAFKKWEEGLHFAAEEKLDPPRSIRVGGRLKGWLQEAGYVDLQQMVYKVPLSGWPRDATLKWVGRHYRDNWVEGLAGFSYKLYGLDGLNWSRDEVEVRLAEVRKALMDSSVHAYLHYWVVYGRKPNEREEKRLRRAGWAS